MQVQVGRDRSSPSASRRSGPCATARRAACSAAASARRSSPSSCRAMQTSRLPPASTSALAAQLLFQAGPELVGPRPSLASAILCPSWSPAPPRAFKVTIDPISHLQTQVGQSLAGNCGDIKNAGEELQLWRQDGSAGEVFFLPSLHTCFKLRPHYLGISLVERVPAARWKAAVPGPSINSDFRRNGRSSR